MNKKAVHHITDTLGRDTIADLMGVSSHMIRHARTTGLFPASWYEPLKVACEEIGIPCPLSAFNWRKAANKVSNGALENQGASQ